VSLREVGAHVAGGLGGDLEIAHVGAAGEGEAGDEGDAHPGADEGAHEAVAAGAAGDTRTEAADRGEHIEDAADLAPPILRTPTATQLAALSYLAVAVAAVVFIAWYAAMKRLGVDRTGLFNGLIPIASLAAVALVGTGTIAPLHFLAALTVLAGVLLGLGRTPQANRPLPHLPGRLEERAGGRAPEHPAKSQPRRPARITGATVIR